LILEFFRILEQVEKIIAHFPSKLYFVPNQYLHFTLIFRFYADRFCPEPSPQISNRALGRGCAPALPRIFVDALIAISHDVLCRQRGTLHAKMRMASAELRLAERGERARPHHGRKFNR
jgi:hypothetical protein